METQNNSSRKDAKALSEEWFSFSATLRLCVIISLLALAGCYKEKSKSYPQDRLTVEYSIDRDEIMVGDPVELVVNAYYPTNGSLQMPEIGRENDVVVLQRNWELLPREDGLTHAETRFSITSFRLGDHQVSSNAIVYTAGDEITMTNFPPVVLHVQSSLPEDASTALADIKPSRKLPGRVPRWIWIVLGATAIAFLTGLITSRLWKHRDELVPAAPPIPPHLIALSALRALKDKGLLERDECKAFYTELSLILRTYLEGRFHLNAPDETTEEIVEEMSRSPELNGAQRNILQDFMRQADMVKFAKGHPDRSTMESAFDTTKQFVEETRTPEHNNED